MPLLEKQLVIRPSTIPQAGQGLFTTADIPKGARIVEYKGRISTWKEVRHDDGGNAYIYHVSNKHVIDASRMMSSWARYSNDARGLTRIKGLTNNAEYLEEGTRVFIVAKRLIPAGSEILVGYGDEYWKTIRHNIRIDLDRKKEEARKEKLLARKEVLKARKTAAKEKARAKALKSATGKGSGKAAGKPAGKRKAR